MRTRVITAVVALAGRRHFFTIEHFEQSRLARAAFSDDVDKFPLFNLKGNIF